MCRNQARRQVIYKVEPVIFTPLGYPDAPPRPKQRKDLSELVRYEHW